MKSEGLDASRGAVARKSRKGSMIGSRKIGRTSSVQRCSDRCSDRKVMRSLGKQRGKDSQQPFYQVKPMRAKRRRSSRRTRICRRGKKERMEEEVEKLWRWVSKERKSRFGGRCSKRVELTSRQQMEWEARLSLAAVAAGDLSFTHSNPTGTLPRWERERESTFRGDRSV